MSTPKVTATVVIPTFNEKENVEALIERLGAALSHYEESGDTVEVLFVDDSHDTHTVDEVNRVERDLDLPHLHIRAIHRTGDLRTGGLAGAVLHGIQEAGSDYVVNMDGDLQHPPELVPQLIDKVRNGTSVVVASRYIPGGNADGLAGGRRVLVSRMATLFTKMVFPGILDGISDPMTGFFAVKRHELIMDRLRDSEGFKILLDILAHHPRLKRGEVPLQFEDRHAGDSKADAGNGMKFIKQLPVLRLRTLPTISSFLLGGALFAGIGAALLFLMVSMGVNPLVAFAVQLVITIAGSFEYNKRFTWYGHTNGRLKRQRTAFFITRFISAGASMAAFPWLVQWAEQNDPFGFGLEIHTQVANVVCLAGATVFNFISSKLVFETKVASRHRETWTDRHHVGLKVSAALLLPVGMSLVLIGTVGFSNWLLWLTVLFAVLSFSTANTELIWRLYGRRTPEAREQMHASTPVRPEDARLSFTFLVAALREAPVIGGTLSRLAQQTHPNAITVATLVVGDDATIHATEQAIASSPPGKLAMVVNSYVDGSKAAQLNHAMDRFPGDPETNFVCPEDAETSVPPGLASHAETLLRETDADVAQYAVLLTNTRVPRHDSWDGPKVFPSIGRFMRQFTPWLIVLLRPFFTSKLWAACRSWFVIHNVLEYFFNWSSRAAYQADKGFMLFGGNTIFIRRKFLQAVGGWPAKLTEDAFLAAVLKSMFPEMKVIAVYDPKLAAREETPPRMFGKGGWLMQRVRWIQGFIEVLAAGHWAKLPTFKQRALAFYSLVMPLLQGLNGIMLPLALTGMVMLKAPVLLVIVMFLPIIPMIITVAVQVLGMREFSRDHGVKFNAVDYLFLVIGSAGYQWTLAIAAMIAIKRHFARQTHWESTEHLGTHVAAATPPQERELVGAY